MVNDLQIQLLGQSGCRLVIGNTVIYFDPYLSNSAYDSVDKSLVRMFPVSLMPIDICDADYVFISHDHIDHCDKISLMGIFSGSKKSIFIGPINVIKKLKLWGVPDDRIILASDTENIMVKNIYVKVMPSAHPEVLRDSEDNIMCVGYVFIYENIKIYLSGDTSLNAYVVDMLKKQAPFDCVLIPVNEDSYYKRIKNIIGNMSIREAMWLANELNAEYFIPVHWDMFLDNSVYIDEIFATYLSIGYSFKLRIYSSFGKK